MNRDWVLVTPPALEPISLEDAKMHLRTGGTLDDAAITRMVRGARADAEEYLGRGLLTQTWRYVQDVWSDEIRLPRAPLQSVIVKYYDASGALVTLASSVYTVDVTAEPGRICLAPGQAWPALQANRAGAVVVTYVVGYLNVASIPPNILDGVYMLLTRRFERRGDDAPEASGALDCPAAEASLAKSRVFWRAGCEEAANA